MIRTRGDEKGSDNVTAFDARLVTDDPRRRLAVKGKALGRKLLGEVGSLVTPDTILGWYRKLIAKKYDSSQPHCQRKRASCSFGQAKR